MSNPRVSGTVLALNVDSHCFALQDIVDKLVEHSATFKGKTEFAQQKYIKKKKKK